MTQEKIAEVIGKDRAVIANTLRLLHLPPGIRHAVVEGNISMGHARALVSLEDEAAQEALFNRIIAEQLPVRTIEQAVREHKKTPKKQAAAPAAKPVEVKQIEEDLQRALGRKVELHAGQDATKGWVRLEFYSLDDLDALLTQLKSARTSGPNTVS
jgi:ParB family chromosome partitioning protein